MGWWRNSSHFTSYILHSLSTVTSNLILHSTHTKPTTSTHFTHCATFMTITPTHCHSSLTFPTHPLLPCTITTALSATSPNHTSHLLHTHHGHAQLQLLHAHSFLYSHHTLLPVPPHLSQWHSIQFKLVVTGMSSIVDHGSSQRNDTLDRIPTLLEWKWECVQVTQDTTLELTATEHTTNY